MNLLSLLTHLPTAVVVAFIVSTVIPALSSLVAKAHWPSEVTGAITLLLSAANGFFAEWAKDGGRFHWKAAVGVALVSYAIALASRLGIFKGTDLDRALLAVGSRTETAADTGPGFIDAPVDLPTHAGPAHQPEHAAADPSA